ncbi:glycoside hydrolase family 16 protein [Streptomyces sp. NBC_01716]|uniref:glycoside hydrolase family 16 protein n=1 Tax=Streptomyces sp. NBC_01716 TaxID=2975917 RepID=UPI002E31BFD1|nr:glycoside hydrolase family 16 protein [Streptomyces sp. NBC_01716]
MACASAVLVGTLAAATLTTPAHADPPPGSTAPAGYQLVFSDDFNGTSLDANAWRTRQSSWVSDDNVKVTGGSLSIDQTRVSTANTETSSFRGGGITTKKRFGYGYYEARVKLPPNTGPFHQSFWTQIWDGQYAKPDYNAGFTEIDIVESFKGQTHGGYLTWLSGQEDIKQSTSERRTMGTPDGRNYNTYGVLYEPRKTTFFLNGTEQGSLAYTSIPNSPMSIWLSTIPQVGRLDGLTDPAGHSYGTMNVDWVRYYSSDGAVPATVPASVPASLTSYHNDFESGTAANWTPVGGSWSVTADGGDHAYRNTASGDVYSLYTATATHFPKWRSTTLSAAVELSGTGGGAGIVGRYTDADNYYYLRLFPETNTVTLVKKVAGSVTTLASHSTTIDPGTTYRLSFELHDARLTAKLNGTGIMSVTDRSLAEGKWGVKGYNQPFSVDDVAMTSP